MASQRALAFTADLDISDVTRGLNRIEMQSRTAGAAVGRVGSGLGRGARGARRCGRSGALAWARARPYSKQAIHENP